MICELFCRVFNIMFKPDSEWFIIKTEKDAVKKMIVYTLILAGITSIVGLIMGVILFINVTPWYIMALEVLAAAFLMFLLPLIFIPLKALFFLDVFDHQTLQGGYIASVEVVAYSMTPLWIAQLLTIIFGSILLSPNPEIWLIIVLALLLIILIVWEHIILNKGIIIIKEPRSSSILKLLYFFLIHLFIFVIDIALPFIGYLIFKCVLGCMV